MKNNAILKGFTKEQSAFLDDIAGQTSLTREEAMQAVVNAYLELHPDLALSGPEKSQKELTDSAEIYRLENICPKKSQKRRQGTE